MFSYICLGRAGAGGTGGCGRARGQAGGGSGAEMGGRGRKGSEGTSQGTTGGGRRTEGKGFSKQRSQDADGLGVAASLGAKGSGGLQFFSGWIQAAALLGYLYMVVPVLIPLKEALLIFLVEHMTTGVCSNFALHTLRTLWGLPRNVFAFQESARAGMTCRASLKALVGVFLISVYMGGAAPSILRIFLGGGAPRLSRWGGGNTADLTALWGAALFKHSAP